MTQGRYGTDSLSTTVYSKADSGLVGTGLGEWCFLVTTIRGSLCRCLLSQLFASLQVFRRMSSSDIVSKVAPVCKQWREVAQSQELWALARPHLRLVDQILGEWGSRAKSWAGRRRRDLGGCPNAGDFEFL